MYQSDVFLAFFLMNFWGKKFRRYFKFKVLQRMEEVERISRVIKLMPKL
jgi:hypothetical protein